MLLVLLFALLLVMSRAFLPKGEAPAREPLRVKIGALEPGMSQGVEWQRQRLLVVRPSTEAHYLAVLDYDPLYGCPLLWVAPGEPTAPLSPWPGGFRAICTEHWYTAQGKALNSEVADLTPVPFTLDAPDTLLFTEIR